jgi:enoyl-CoA hydratase
MRLRDADVLYVGFATGRIPAGREEELVPALSSADWTQDAHAVVDRALAWVTADPGTPPPSAHLDATDWRFRFDSVEEIFAAVENKGTDSVSDTLKNLRHMLPTCLKVNLRHMRPGPSCRSIMP